MKKFVTIVFSYKYSDYLKHSLPRMVEQSDAVILVTTEEDESYKLAQLYPSLCVLLMSDDQVHLNNAVLNKSLAVRLGQQLAHKLYPDYWLLITDADIIFPDNLKQIINEYAINPKIFYGIKRLNYFTYDNYLNNQHNDDFGPTFAGYFQLYHPKTNNYPLYDQWSYSAEKCDADFSRRFYFKKELPHYVKHIGFQGINWEGRIAPIWDKNIPYKDIALQSTVLPNMYRPSIYMYGVLQICVTRACDKSCFGCTQGSNLGGKPMIMTPKQYKEALESIEGYFGVVGMFGGNPAIHPQFEELCKILQKSWVPKQQRGIWCNNPMGKAKIMRETFYAPHSNLNVHLDQKAYDDFFHNWPESRKCLKGLDTDSRHSPVYVALKDVVPDEEERWKLIANCDINKYWSALIGVFRGELRGWFCEIAGAQSMLHQNNPDYPDTGLKIYKNWWNSNLDSYKDQIEYHCNRCGVPLKGYGELAVNGYKEQVSKEHINIYKTKDKNRKIEVIKDLYQIQPLKLEKSTDYIENGSV